MNNTDEQIGEIKSMVTKLSKRVIELTATIKAYRKSELNVNETAAFLGVSKKTVQNRMALGHLHGFKKGGTRFFTIQELEDYVSANKSR